MFPPYAFPFYFIPRGSSAFPVIPLRQISAFIVAFVRQRTEGFGDQVSMSIQRFCWKTDRENIMESLLLKNAFRSAVFVSVVTFGVTGAAHAAGTGDQVGQHGDMSGQGGPVSKQGSQGSQGSQGAQGAQGSGESSQRSSGSSMSGQSTSGAGGSSGQGVSERPKPGGSSGSNRSGGSGGY
jgi:hypothetical protein